MMGSKTAAEAAAPLRPAVATADLRLLLRVLASLGKSLRGSKDAEGRRLRDEAVRLRTVLEYTNGHVHRPEDLAAAQAVLACWRGRRSMAGFRAALALAQTRAEPLATTPHPVSRSRRAARS